MAESRESTILDVKLDAGKVAQDLQDLITRIAALKAQQKELNDQIKAGNDIDGKYAEQLIRVKDQLAWTEKQAKGLSATTKLLNADTLTYSDSLNGERQKLADMQKAYDQLDKAQRESEGGKAFLEAIRAQSDAVKGLEEDTGRFQRNVGNYQSAFEGAAEKAKVLNEAFKQTAAGSTVLGKGIDTVDKTAKVFAKNPFMAIIGLLAPILAKIVSLVTKNEKAVAAFRKVTEPVGKVLQFIADIIANTLVAALNALKKAWDAVSSFFGTIVSWFTGGSSAIESNTRAEEEAARAAKEYADQVENLEKQLAKEQKQLKQLRADNKYHIDMLKARGAAEKEIYEAEKKAREDELQQILDINTTAAEEMKAFKEKLRKEGKVAREDEYNFVVNLHGKEYEEFLAEYNRLRDLINNSYEDRKEKQREYDIWLAEEETKRINKEEEERKKQNEEFVKSAEYRAKVSREINQQAEDFTLSLIKDETARAIAQRKIQGEREIQALQERLETEENITEESRNQLAELIKGKQAALDAELEKMATDAANAKSEAEIQAEKEKAMRILEYRRELAEEGSESELAIQKEILDAQLAQALENTELEEEEKLLIRQTFAKKAEELDKEYHENLKKQAEDARAAYKESLKATASTASQTFGALSDLLAQYGEENEEAAAASKAFGIMQIITDQAISIADTAKAITAAVAGATEAAAATGPAAPFVLAGYIAAMVGAVIGAIGSIASTIAQAKQLMASADKDAGKFATGGVVGGTSYSGDKLIAHVNSGEGIYTGTQANNLLQEIANNPVRGGFDYSAMAEAMAVAVAAQPAPVVVYSELQEFGKKVSTYNEIASV